MEKTKITILHTFACALAAANESSVGIIRELILDMKGREEASIWVDGSKVPCTNAARVNAGMA